LLGVALVAASAYSGWIPPVWKGSDSSDRPLTTPVYRGTLRIVVTERGNLESVKTIDGVCELTGFQNKIIELVPEGNQVKKGDVVCRFDSQEIDKNIAQQEIKVKQALSKIETTRQEVEIARNKGESEIIKSQVDLSLAELDLEMYQKGTYIAEIEEILGNMGLQSKDLAEAKNKRDQYQTLVKKGFKTPQDLNVEETNVKRLQVMLQGVETKHKVKKDYEYKRKSTEFSAKADQARKGIEQARATLKASLTKTESEYEAAKATHTIENQQLEMFLKQKEKCEIKAEQGGVVAYANEPWFGSDRQIREGATIYSRQKIFSLPDMSNMQVKVSIHESLVKKIKPGLMAEIRVDAFPNLVLVGKVKTVSQLADSNRGWMTGGVKEYTTVVTVEKMPKEDLKPGMTAEVKINVSEIDDVLLVPIQSVAEHKGEFFAFVTRGDRVERRKVKVGDTNEKLVQVIDGLNEGEQVALDARSRASIEFKADENADAVAKSKTAPKPAPAPEPAPGP
jgi:RND family efflux transporter MFP subunit